MSDTVRKMFDLVGRGFGFRWAVLVTLAILVSALEMVGAVMVFLLMGLVADLSGDLELPVVGDLRGRFDGVTDETFLIGMVVALGLFFVVRALAQVGFAYVKHRIAHNSGARLASRLMRGYLRLPYAFHLRRHSAELVRNTQQTVEELASKCFLPVIYVIAEGIVILGLISLLMVIAPLATVLAIVIMGTAAIVLLMVVQPRLKRLGAVAQDMHARTLGTVQQALHGVRDIKVLAAEDAFARVYRRNRFRLSRTQYVRGAITEVPRHVMELALLGFILGVFAVSLTAGVASEELLATLGLFAYSGLRLQPSLQKVVSGLNNIRFSGPAVDHIHADLLVIEESERHRRADGPPLGFRRELRLSQVAFAYEATAAPALSHIELTIARGEVLGICGPTGGGKTTLVDLITGILEPTEGRLTVDGHDLHDNLPGWFRKLGVVPQMTFLIDDTLRVNIALGVDPAEVDEAAVAEAVGLAQLDGFVASLPDGLDTMVGERGVRVSGGQRQRVAIARALYRRPEVLIFDEGTSALDTATESVLISSLERLRGQHTIIMVAHRLSTVRNCDRIAYLDDGRIRGIGTFEDLMTTNEGFRALAQSS